MLSAVGIAFAAFLSSSPLLTVREHAPISWRSYCSKRRGHSTIEEIGVGVGVNVGAVVDGILINFASRATDVGRHEIPQKNMLFLERRYSIPVNLQDGVTDHGCGGDCSLVCCTAMAMAMIMATVMIFSGT